MAVRNFFTDMKDSPEDSFVLLQVDSPNNPSVQLSCSPDICRVIQDFTETAQYWDFPKQTRKICDIYCDTIAQVQRNAKRRIICSNRKDKIKKIKDITRCIECSYKITRSTEFEPSEPSVHVPERAPSYLTDTIVNFDFSKLWEAMLIMIEQVFILYFSLKKKLKGFSVKYNCNWPMSRSFVKDTVESYYLPNLYFKMSVRVFLSRSWRTHWCVIVQGTPYYVEMDSTDYCDALKGPIEHCQLLFWELRKAANEHGPYLPENETLPEPSGEPISEYDIMIDLGMDLDRHVVASIVTLCQCPDYLSSRRDDKEVSMREIMMRFGCATMELVREKTKSLQDRDEEDLADENEVIPYIKDNGPFRIQITVDVFVRCHPTVTLNTVPASLTNVLDVDYYPLRIGVECSSLVEKLLGVYHEVKPYRPPLPGQEPDVTFTYVTDESMMTFESISCGPNSPADLPGEVRQLSKSKLWGLLDEMVRHMFREYYYYKCPLFPVPEGVNPIDWID